MAIRARYAQPVPGGRIGRTDQGVDISAPPGTPVLAITRERLVGIIDNWYSGQPFYWFEGVTASGKGTGIFNYVAEQFRSKLHIGDIAERGQPVGSVAQSGTGLELGWATRSGRTLAASTTGYKEGQVTPAGQDYSQQVIQGGSSNTLANLWIQAGGSPHLANLMAAIALAESGGQVGQKGGPNNNGTYDYGLWQINSSHSQFDQNRLLSDPLYNAQAAVSVYKSQGLTAWSTYNSGAYKTFLSQGSSAAPNYGGDSGGRVRPGGETSGSGSGTVLDASLFDPGSIDLNPFDLWKNIIGSIHSVSDFLQLISWIALPVNWLRAVEFLTGILLMGFGIMDTIKRNSPSLASTGAGIARVTKEVVEATPAGRELRMAKGTRAGTREGQVEHARLEARRASRQREASREQQRGQRRRELRDLSRR